MSLVRRNHDNYFPTQSFGGLLDQFFNTELFDWPTRNFSSTNTTLPAINIKEEEDRFTVEMAAPGMKKEDFKLEIDNNKLTISSEHKTENEEVGNDNYTRREFSYQSFVRSFNLPETVDSDQIKASYENGVLLLDIPKKEEAKPKPVKLIDVK
ncbi:MAG: heat-shock protein [Thalassobius sp.]|nr:heat-shock protein [Thalassovita sp.]